LALKLSSHEITALLGKGCMGEVYRAGRIGRRTSMRSLFAADNKADPELGAVSLSRRFQIFPEI
jgi:hypothetical protein